MSRYPFSGDAPYVRGQWYLAAWSDELGHAALGRRFLGEDVILYRTGAGEPTALSGLCPHRWMPLAEARVENDGVVCPYHGARFAASGACDQAPGQTRAPPRLALRRYPLVERSPCIWIWMGEPAAADVALVPDATSLGLGAPGWQVERVRPFRLQARAQLLIENLFDQSHVAHVHAGTLAEFSGDERVEVTDSPQLFSVARERPPTPPDPGMKALFPNLGDHVQSSTRTEMLGVSLVNSVGSRTYSVDDAGGAPRLAGEMNFVHGVSPETETTTHYFVAIARTFAVHDAELSRVLMERNIAVIREDAAILERIEPVLDVSANIRLESHFGSDAAAMQVRARMQALRNVEASKPCGATRATAT